MFTYIHFVATSCKYIKLPKHGVFLIAYKQIISLIFFPE